MNHMPEVAKMLGVEMGERFKIKNSFFTDTYTDTYLMRRGHINEKTTTFEKNK